MSESSLPIAALLGVLEGLTEFIPVSSTGHLLLASHFLGFDTPGRTFSVVIQLGAVLALFSVYALRLWDVVRAAPSDPDARRFVLAVLVAFLPAAVLGVLGHDLIKTVLFETPALIAVMLILGGIVLLVVDRWLPAERHDDAMQFPLPLALKIGLFQCLSLIPGVSRSGATILGALLMGASKRAAAEFSFFLSIPTMLGAVIYDLWANRAVLDWSALHEIAVGFTLAFVTALIVVKWLLDYVSRRGYALFGWWRIAVGSAALAGLWVVG
jgi:undecaprenyl-diphosphatase